MIKRPLLIPLFFVLLGIFLALNKLIGLATAEERRITSVETYRKTSLKYTKVCVEGEAICFDISAPSFYKKQGDAAYIYQEMDLSTVAFLLLPSQTKHPFFVTNIWKGFGFGEFIAVIFNVICLIPLFLVIWIRQRFKS